MSERIVVAAGTSAVQHSCSLYTISNFQNKRGIIQTTMEDNLREKLEGPDGSGAGKGVFYAHTTRFRSLLRLFNGAKHVAASYWL